MKGVYALMASFLVSQLAMASASADTEHGYARHIDPVIDQAVGPTIVGTTIIVIEDGRIVYERAAGYADREKAEPARLDTIYRFSSLSKPIIATLAVILAERGIIALDAPVSEYRPDLTFRLANGEPAMLTLRHLLTHTAGMTYDFFEEEGSPFRAANVSGGLDQPGLSMEENLQRLQRVPLKFRPGSQWHYSMATDVLGAVIETATALPLEEATRRYLLDPLGMTDTSFGLVDADRLASAYADGKPQPVRIPDTGMVVPFVNGMALSPARIFDLKSYPSAGAGMSGTAGDFARLILAWMHGEGTLVSADGLRLLLENQIGDLRAWTEGEGWGFGFAGAVLLDQEAAATPHNPGTVQWGGVWGNHWFYDPDTRLAAVMLSNTAVAGMFGDYVDAIRDAIYAAYREQNPGANDR